MALAREEPPPDAVLMSEVQAAGYWWDLVSGWSTKGDTWALRYGSGILGGFSALSGIIINSHYRTRLRLGSYGHFSSLLPIVLLPGMFSALFHRTAVSTDILLQKKESCFICYEIRSAVIQCGFGVTYPMILAPTSGFMFAIRYSTHRVPSLYKEPKQLMAFLIKISRPLSGTLVALTVLHLFASSILTYYETQNSLTLSRKIRELEDRIDNGDETSN